MVTISAGPHLVLVAGDPVAVGDMQPVRVSEDAVDAHGLDHDAAEILPRRKRDLLALLRRLLGEGALEIGERALVAAVMWRDQPPSLGRDGAGEVERKQPHEPDQEAQADIFGLVAQVAPGARSSSF